MVVNSADLNEQVVEVILLVYILQILRKDHSVRFTASAKDIGSDVDLAAGCHCYANVAIRTDATGGAGQSK